MGQGHFFFFIFPEVKSKTIYKQIKGIIMNKLTPQQTKLFKGLTRLFSGPITNRRVQTVRRYKRRDLDKFNFTSASGQAFKKLTKTFYERLNLNFISNQNRVERYADFDQMEYDPIISSCIDLYAEEMTTHSTLSPLLNIKCRNEEIKNVLRTLFYEILNIDFNLRYWARTICKYGDLFAFLDIDPQMGIKNVIGLPPHEIERLEGQDKTNPNYVQFQWNSGNLTLENCQVAHFRILGNDKYSPYGTCLKNDTRILTSNGIKTIDEIEIGDIIVNYNIAQRKKKYSKVLDTVHSGKKECFKISTRHNFIEASKEHKIAVAHQGNIEKIEYKFVDELKVGDLLLINKKHNLDKQIPIDKTKPDGKNYNGFWNTVDNVPDNMTEEFAQLFGFLIGDGWIPKHNSTVNFALGDHELLNQKYVNLIEKFSGSKVKYYRSSKRLKCSQIVCNSKMLATILERMDFKGNVYTKRIPLWVFSASKKIKEAFIQGLFDADGSIFIDKWNCARFQFELSNEQLIKDTKILIQSLGYKTGKIGTRHRTHDIFIENRKIKTTQPSFYFYYFLSKNRQSKKNNLFPNDDVILEPIISIETTGKHEVYDIEVDNKDHNFFANGIVTHNSILDPARRIFRQVVLLKDNIIAYRVVRSSERRVFYIDVGGIPPDDVEQMMQKVITQMKRAEIVNEESGQVDLRYNPMCYFPEDHVYTTDGQMLNIGQLAKDWTKRKEDIHVWSLNEKQEIVPTKLLWAGQTHEKTKFIEVTLDDGQIIKTTPEHKWLLRDGTKVEAKDLKPEDSLMPFYAKVNTELTKRHGGKDNFYTNLYNPGLNKWQTAHKIVATHKYGHEIKWPNLVHHVNHCKLDNNPENLLELTQHEHGKIHKENIKFLNDYARSEQGREKSRQTLIKNRKKYDFKKISVELWKNPKIRKKRIDKLSLKIDSKLIHYVIQAIDELGTEAREYQIREHLNNNEDFVNYLKGLNPNFKNGFNHKLVKMQFLYALRKINFKNLREVKDFYVSLKAPFDKIEDFCQNGKIKSRFSVFTHFGIGKYDFTRLVHRHNLTLEEFDAQYLNDQRWKYCEQQTGTEIHNHSVVSVREYELESTAYGLTVENSTHIVAIGGFNAPKLRNKIWKSGVFITNSIEQDYFLPVRGDDKTKIETLPGGKYTGDVDDLKLLQSELFAALKVPQSYLMRGEGADEDKASLSQKDIRFARTILHLQNSIISGLEKIATAHLFVLGYRSEDLVSFELSLNNPSKLAELQEFEHWRSKFDIAKQALDTGFFCREIIAKKFFNMTDEEIVQNQRGLFTDAMLEAELEKVKTGGEEGIDGGMGGGELDGIEGLEGMGDMPDDEGEEEDESMILSPPAKRKDEELKQPDRRHSAGYTRHIKRMSMPEFGTFRRSHPGYQDIMSIGKGISETVYAEEYSTEQKLKTLQGLITEMNNTIQKQELLNSNDTEYVRKNLVKLEEANLVEQLNEISWQSEDKDES